MPPRLPELSTLTPTATEMLVRLAGEVDGTFRVVRRCDDSSWAASWVAQDTYRRSGCIYASRAENNAQAKQSERDLVLLTQAQLVRVSKSKVKSTRFKLTFNGHWLARGVTLGFSLPEAVEIVRKLHSLGGDVEWINEYRLLNPEKPATKLTDAIGRELKLQQALLTACRIEGWADFNCTTQRAGYWMLTPAGIDVATGAVVPVFDLDVPDLDEDRCIELIDVFHQAAAVAQARLEDPRNRPPQEIGPCPLRPNPTRRVAAAAK